MSEEDKPRTPVAEKSYYIGEVGAHSTAIQGEHITNIQQMFPQTADGEFLSYQFAKLTKEINDMNAATDQEKAEKELALEKTESVAKGLAKAQDSPKDLQKAILDVKSYESGKLSWIWNKAKQILTSEQAKRIIEKIADKAIQTVIKSFLGIGNYG